MTSIAETKFIYSLVIFIHFSCVTLVFQSEAIPYRCGLSEGSNELRGALGCFLLDTYYVNGEERENKGREPRRRGVKGSFTPRATQYCEARTGYRRYRTTVP